MTDDNLELMFVESWHAGEVYCEECGIEIDLTDTTLDEAREMWNEHVRSEHSEGAVR